MGRERVQIEGCTVAEVLGEDVFRDALTGLSNRYGLDRHFTNVCNSQGLPQPYCLIFLDLDNFKAVNDSYGHAVGDQVLQYFAKQLGASMRKNDFCCRWGGDEFLMLLPDVKQDSPLQELERRFQALRELVYQVDHVFVKVGFSFGFSFFPHQSANLQELIHIADVNLLEMKHKNR